MQGSGIRLGPLVLPKLFGMSSSAQEPGQIHDLLVVGGGVAGCGLARDAAGRGLSVYLCEKDDLGSGASSASTKLVHGGLCDLERYRLATVREALAERERLLAIAPHVVAPIRLVLPHDPVLRAAWKLRAGLFLYDHLGDVRPFGGSSRLAIGISVDLRSHRYGRPLKPDYPRGFVHSECWADDARLVLFNAMDAAARGARIATRTALVGVRRETDHWVAQLRRHGAEWQVRARLLANAAGPAAEQLRQAALGGPVPLARHRAGGPGKGEWGEGGPLRLVRGSHIVVPRLFQGSQGYAFQTDDRRLVFALPYHGAFTLIGTTEVPQEDPAQPPQASREEIAYLCRAANRYLKRSIGPQDVVDSYAGVRALCEEDGSGDGPLSRLYRLQLDGAAGGDETAPLLTILGGSLTTYRQAAEAALQKVAPLFPRMGRPWTGRTALPGGDIAGGDAEAFAGALLLRYPGLDRRFLRHLSRRHGSLSDKVLGNAKRPADLGRDFGGGLTECEVDWLHRHEWAETAEDILWRRTKAGLFMSGDGRALFADWFERQIAA